MRKFLTILGVLITLILLIIVILFSLFLFIIKPNNLKPLITAQVQQATGRELVINGDLHWTLFPTLGIKVDDILLKNTESFAKTPLATMQHATISVKLMPLFHHDIQTQEIIVRGLSLHLMKNKNGQTNWADLINKPKAQAPTQQTPAPKPTQANTPTRFKFSIPQITIQDASISWKDNTTGKQATLDHIDFNAKNISTTLPFPIHAALQIKSNQPQIAGHMNLDSKISINPSKKQIQLSQLKVTTTLKGQSLPGGKLDGTLSTNLLLGMNQLHMDKLQLQLNKTHCNGSLNINDIKNLQGTFTLNMDTLNLDQWKNKQAAKNRKIKAPSAATTMPIKQNNQPLPKILKQIKLTGQVATQRLIASKLQMKNVKLNLSANNGLITVAPIKTQLYQGTFNGKLVLNAKGSTLLISKQGNLRHINFQSLFTDLSGYKKLQGLGNLQFAVTTRGLTESSILRNLNGNAKFNLANGAIKNIDIAYMIRAARAIIKKQLPPPNRGGNQTNFGSFTGTAQIHNGVISCNDLRIVSKAYTVTGKGTVNLVNKKMNYRLEINPEDPNIKFTIPVLITGTYDKPSPALDKAEILKRLLVSEPTKKIKEKIHKKIKQEIGKQLEQLRGFIS